MRIGTVRPEEARVSDTYAGYHQFHAEESQEPYGGLEVFWQNQTVPLDGLSDGGEPYEDDELTAAGWYWWACFPGCLPDSDASGPFASSRQALEDADEWNPEFDDDFAN